MTRYKRPQDILTDDIFLDLDIVLGLPLTLKVEAMNLGGSLKVKTARSMVDKAIAAGLLTSRSTIVESSSGNLGVALAMIAAAEGLRFVCVADINTNEGATKLIRAFGGEVIVVDKEGDFSTLVERRIAIVREIEKECGAVWLNQYSSSANPEAHSETTAPAVFAEFPLLDLLFVGVGTGGTARGCADYISAQGLRTRLIGVDSIGSAALGGPNGRRVLPGLGSGRRSDLLSEKVLDRYIQVPESASVRMCRHLASHGILVGASTGTLVAGAVDVLRPSGGDPLGDVRGVIISADMGDRYVDTVFQDAWCRKTGLVSN